MTIHAIFLPTVSVRFMRETGVILGLILLTGLIEIFMGMSPICSCGTVKLWHGLVNSSETSQHIADWYTFTHMLHGLMFWGLANWANRKFHWNISTFTLLLAAVLMECGWEILENTSFIVERYRQTAISHGYTGDSIVNSLSDIVAMIAGFLIATRFGGKTLWGIFIAGEIFMGATVRDNLTLNVIMLIHPVPAINAWQAQAK